MHYAPYDMQFYDFGERALTTNDLNVKMILVV